MFKNLLAIGLVFANFLLSGCNLATSKAVETQITVEVAKPLEPVQEKIIFKHSGGKVEFKGVSFNYSPRIFDDVEASEVPEQLLENETDMPDNVAPQHLFFTFKSQNQNVATIAVYPIEDFRRVWLPVEKNNTMYFNENLKNVKKFIADKNFRENGEIPHLPCNGGIQTFEAKVKSFSFQSGTGIFYLTQRVQEAAIVNNGHLEYAFQGISENGKYYILAQSSPKVSFLPNDYHVGKFENYSMPDTVNWTDSEQNKYDEYIAKITKRLENLPSDKYEPNLNYFEEIISSLKIEK